MTRIATFAVLAAAIGLFVWVLTQDSGEVVQKPDEEVPLQVNHASRSCVDRNDPEGRPSGRPFCTIRGALANARGDDVIVLRGGTYRELALRGIKRRSDITLRPYKKERVTLRGLDVDASSHIRFEGLRIAGQVILERSRSIALIGNDITPRGVSVRAGSSAIRIERNRIHDLEYQAEQFNGGYAVLLAGSGGGIRDVTVRGNRISRVPIDGIQVASVDGLLIEGNDITEVTKPPGTDVHSDSIQLLGGNRVTIRSNLIHGNSHGIMNTNNEMPGLSIERNVIVNITGGFGVMLADAGPAVVANNTLWNTQYGLVIRDGSREVTVKGNVLDRFDSGRSHLAVEDGNLIASGHIYGENDIDDEPAFVNPDALDYRLSPGSPGADAGLGANRGG